MIKLIKNYRKLIIYFTHAQFSGTIYQNRVKFRNAVLLFLFFKNGYRRFLACFTAGAGFDSSCKPLNTANVLIC